MSRFNVHILLFCTVVCLSLPAKNVFAFERVVLEDAGESVIVNYSGLIAEGFDINQVRVHRCISPPKFGFTARCETQLGSASPAVRSDNRITIDQKGLFLVELYKPVYSAFGETFVSLRVWQQYVVNLYKPRPDLIRAIEKHAPVYSFYKDEDYYPVSIGRLFDRPVTDFTLSQPLRGSVSDAWSSVSQAPNAAAYLASNAGANFRAIMNTSDATLITGSKSDFPVYWMVDELIPSKKVNVTFFALFGYDEKIRAYLIDDIAGTGLDPSEQLQSLGQHELDRESVTVTFESNGNNWAPTEIIYAAHLPSQVTFFIGCENGPECKQASQIDDVAGGNDIVSWQRGATRLLWSNASLSGDRPIVYVAHGSHAHYPARGFYRLGTIAGEPAGNLEKDNKEFSEPTLIQLELSNPAHAALRFSGNLIEAGVSEVQLRYRVFPYIRYPTDSWLEDKGRTFNDCAADSNQFCIDYMNKERTECYGVGENISLSLSPLGDDSDGDGVDDIRDAFPGDATETADLNNDGQGDNAFPVAGLTTITGFVKDTVDSPISGATVRIDMSQALFGQEIVVQTKTASDGSYRLDVDINELPQTFAMSVISSTALSNIALFRPASGSENINRDIVLEKCSAEIVQIDKAPIVHHVGNDSFEGATNSQFQRFTEAQIFEYEFQLPANINDYNTFDFQVLVKGVNDVGTSFQFNDANSVVIPGAQDDGSFFNSFFQAKVSDYLKPGQNRFRIGSGSDRITGDFDDFEYANPVLFFSNQ